MNGLFQNRNGHGPIAQASGSHTTGSRTVVPSGNAQGSHFTGNKIVVPSSNSKTIECLCKTESLPASLSIDGEQQRLYLEPLDSIAISGKVNTKRYVTKFADQIGKSP